MLKSMNKNQNKILYNKIKGSKEVLIRNKQVEESIKSAYRNKRV